jgi:sigma-B regulation protein RsbQ
MDDLSRFNIKVSGQGKQTIMFAHGYGCDQAMWRHVAPAFEADYSVVLFDYVGARTSNCKYYDRVKYASLQGYADDVNLIISGLGLYDVHFVGHSVSAMIGVLASAANPMHFKSLSFVAPSPCYINDGSYHGGMQRHEVNGMLDYLTYNYLGWAGSITPHIMANSDKPYLAKELEESFCQTDPEISKLFAGVTFLSDNRKDLCKVQHPTLVMQCSEDVIAPYVVGRYVHESIPSSQFVLLKATGHCPNLSAPLETASVIKQFLKAQS